MNGEQDKILHMLQEGTISAEEAQSLLNAVEDSKGGEDSWDRPEDVGDHYKPRNNWQRPFGFFLVSTTFWGSLLIRSRKAAGFSSFIRILILFPLTFISAVGAWIIYISKDGPWLHLQFRSSENEKLSFSLPFPLNILRGGLQFVNSKIEDDEAGEKLNAASDLLEALEIADYENPVSIDIEEKGNNIQIYVS